MFLRYQEDKKRNRSKAILSRSVSEDSKKKKKFGGFLFC